MHRRLRRSSLVAPLAALLLPALAACCAAAPRHAVAAAAADLVIPDGGAVRQGTLDLGALRLSRQTRVTAEFTLKNRGGGPVVVSRIDLPCGCLSAVIEGADGEAAVSGGGAARLRPGESVRVKLDVDLLQVPAGPFAKAIAIYREGREEPAAVLNLTGRVLPAVRFDPPAVNLGRRESGEPWSARVVIEVDEAFASAEKFPEVVAEPADALRAVPVDGAKPERDSASGMVRTTYTVSLAPGAPLGALEARIRVKPESAAPAAAVVSNSAFLVVGNIAGPVTARPQLVLLGSVEAGDAARGGQTVTLVGESADAVKDLAVSASSPHVTATLGPPAVGAPQERVLTLSVGPDAPAGPLKETVSVRLADGRRLLIPVSARVRRTAPPTTAAGLVGRTIPAFTLPDLTGGQRTVRGATGGRPTALFFFCGCGACFETATEWARLQRGGLLDGVDTVIVYHEVSAEGIRSLSEQMGLDAARTLLLRDETTPGVAASRFDAPKCPRVFTLGADGIVRYTNAGKDDDPEAKGAPAAIAARALESVQPKR